MLRGDTSLFLSDGREDSVFFVAPPAIVATRNQRQDAAMEFLQQQQWGFQELFEVCIANILTS